jgi:hypothetical protein
MSFELKKSIEILERTPATIEQLLSGISDVWIYTNEGENTWSPFDVLGHLLHGEKTDWIERLNIILSDSGNKKFTPFDRFAQFNDSKGKTINDLLKEFKELRQKNMSILKSKNIDESMLNRKGIHPALGEVTLENLLATWVAHDLNHISQIVRVMAKQYKSEVGPWAEYLRIMR